MLEVNNLSISVNNRYLIKHLSFVLNEGDKLAIIGEEGNGKSTLLKAILGNNDYAEVNGMIDAKGNTIGYLEQSMSNKYLNKKVFNYLFEDENDYYNKINSFYKYLEMIDLRESILEQVIKTLSGGEKVKISILKLLMNEYDILLLDEPTNDLDIQTLEWLEIFINDSEKPIMYVSHDETLLSNTANMILHLEQIYNKRECRHTLVRVDYDTYVSQRLRALEKQTQLAKSEKRDFEKKQERLRQIMQKVEHQQNNISRKDPHGGRLLKKKMHSIKAQEKKLDNVDLTKMPDVEESIFFDFEEVQIPRTKVIANISLPELKIDNKVLSKNIKIDIVGNSHICIIGKNGVGKSTLIKYIYGEIKDREDIKVGYMPQTYDDILGNYEYVLDFLAPSGLKSDITTARTSLGNMNFTSEEMTTKISNLSNGTKAKLFLVKLMLDKCDVLVLDEPTRNVSPLSNPVIRDVLRRFKGTIISVSHDRKYLEEVIDKLFILSEDGLKEINESTD